MNANDVKLLTMTTMTNLRALSSVPIHVDCREDDYEPSIMISELKMETIIQHYEAIHSFMHKAWRNLPNIPNCDPTHLIVWMIASEGYEVNHKTLVWKGASANTFAYAWTMIDRLRDIFDSTNTTWVIGDRSSIGYCEAMEINEPTDKNIYRPMGEVTGPFLLATRAVSTGEVKGSSRDFVSFFDFELAMMMPMTWLRTRRT